MWNRVCVAFFTDSSKIFNIEEIPQLTSIHLTLLERTRPASISHLDSVSQAGAFFPDAFYSCMGLSDAAEYTHWPPFLKLAVDYWREKYGGGKVNTHQESKLKLLYHPWKSLQRILTSGSLEPEYNDASALKAFIFAMLGHQVADVSWHSLGVHQGLLEMLAAREFEGDLSAAHQLLDTGGDFIYLRNLMEGGMDMNWYRNSWDYPKQDLLEIFSRAGFLVSGPQLDYCMLRGRTAIQLELRSCKAGFGPYASKSPILVDQLDSYYLGGLSEMTASIKYCSNKLESWFENGTPFDPWSICDVFYLKKIEPISNLDSDRPLLSNNSPGESSIIQAHIQSFNGHPIIKTRWGIWHNLEEKENDAFQGQTGNLVSVTNYTDEPCLVVSSPYMPLNYQASNEIIGGIDLVPISKIKDQFKAKSNSIVYAESERIQPGSSNLSFYGFNQRFGAQVDTITIDGNQYLVVSRPGISTIEFHLKGIPMLQIMWTQAEQRYGVNGTKLMGEQLMVSDIDNDGFEDLIIGSPSTDVDGVPQAGKVHIIKGKNLSRVFSKLLKSKLTSRFLQVPVEYFGATSLVMPPFELKPKDGITLNKGYHAFGSKLAVVKDSITNETQLLVGCEGLDSVYGFSGDELRMLYVLTGDSTDSKFGGSLLQTTDSGLIAIGAASEGKSCPQCGAVYIYEVKDGNPPILLKKIEGHDVLDGKYIRFGYQGLSIEDDYLLVSSPSAHKQSGVLWIVDLNSGKAQVLDIPKPGMNSGFGTSLTSTKFENEIIVFVGMPYHVDKTYGDGSVIAYRFDSNNLTSVFK